ncbi:hypothetical protein Aca07nite_38180 [Actinoplanes capillaceus]|uniref:Uncharacterized protein n=1 Tax=Actinoplanes campanulatus TaxID=113559 RepID=A0ABQ3WJX2_9ACTN|nr:DUF6193 family natural product biosynthesis protein [Actinoplanes capillaceus]GID46543.1 hypothetical protein Aca07nite_38180 [Actinoplanes capillaceus]
MSAAPDPLHYSDIVAAGDLRTALQARFDESSVPLRAEVPSSPGWIRVGARIETGDRQVTVLMAVDDRAFLLEFWMRGVRMARGRTADLGEVAAGIGTFLSGATVAELSATHAFVTYGGFAEAFERGEAEAIAFRWARYLDGEEPVPHGRQLDGFLRAAAEEPRLRALYPFTSHWDFGLRPGVADTPNRAVAWIRPVGDRYLVAGGDRGDLDRTADPVGASDAVARILATWGRSA